MAQIGPGTRISDRYAVLEELGRGGMGVVFLARDEIAGRDVAVKVLREAPQGEAARRLRREARAMGDLDPKGVAQVYDVGETPDGELYLVMEYVAGRTLRSLARAGRLERGEALRIVRELAATLGQAHARGLVHRDVKPDNVIVGASGRVVLLDFGIVKRMAVGEETSNLSTQLTAEGSVIGTPAYLSPEQALGREIGPRTDQFALAVIAYELLVGQLPWTATDMTTMLAQVLAETPHAPSFLEQELNASFDAVLARGLAKNPAARFATVEELAAALEAAERGDYVPLDVVETVSVPLVPTTGGAARSTTARRRFSPWIVAASVGAGVIVAGGAFLGLRNRFATGKSSENDVNAALRTLANGEGRLACPIFEVRGMPEVAVRLGAAAATVVCGRVSWFLGGRDERILPPAALLDVPREPTPNFGDPYVEPVQIARTVSLARARAAAYLEGVLSREAEEWKVVVTLRAADGVEIRRGEGHDHLFFPAIGTAVAALWLPPLPTLPIDPAVSRWTWYPDAETGGAVADMTLFDSSAGCSHIASRARDLGPTFFILQRMCESFGGSAEADAGVPKVDDSSPQALAASAEAVLVAGNPLPSIDDKRRMAARLEELRAGEHSSLGRAALAKAAAVVWVTAQEPERARADYMAVLRDDPLVIEAWQNIIANVRESAIAPVAAAWFPSETTFLVKASSHRGDELQERLVQSRLAYVFEPELVNVAHLGRALAEAGRAEEVRALAATPLGDAADTRTVSALLSAFIDLHQAKLAQAIARLQDAGSTGMSDLVVASDVAGRTGDVATKWASLFLSLPDEQVALTARGYDAPMVLCMRARSDLATRCLDRIARLGHADVNWWGDGGEELLQGAQRYARGDVRGAVSIWRPLVAGPNEEVFRILPTEAFERAGQPELAARLDGRKLPYTGIAGVSDAAPREAHRAAAAGDTARAKKLAQGVITAWEVADVEVPAVADMRALLKMLHD